MLSTSICISLYLHYFKIYGSIQEHYSIHAFQLKNLLNICPFKNKTDRYILLEWNRPIFNLYICIILG